MVLNKKNNKYWVAAGVVGVAIAVFKYRSLIANKLKTIFSKDLLLKQKIEVIESKTQCDDAIHSLSRGCKDYKVLGFDCEWVTTNGRRHPVALLQLTSADGYCALFRLSKIRHVPHKLKEILENEAILKVGVAPFDDAHNMLKDYNVCVNGTLDLRHLALSSSETPEGLSAMSLKHLDIKLDKDWRLRCSDWEADVLDERQTNYAATDAFVAIEIFTKFMRNILTNKHGINSFQTKYVSSDLWIRIFEECEPFINRRFKHKSNNTPIPLSSKVPFEKLISDEQKRGMNYSPLKQFKRGYVTRSKPLYENCYMLNPMGQVLSTCDTKKAKWYVEKGLANFVSEDPLTIQLNFKPSGDVAGDVDKYYQIPRENKCVVCGHDDSYIRKNVIPREYRKLFPVVMKSHSSHDVLLLCTDCHQLSNTRDIVLRNKLSVQCEAPIDSKNAVVVHRNLQRVASAAKALLEATQTHNIPQHRKVELENVIKEYYDTQEITKDLLQEALKLKFVKENPLYESHGKKVVEHFSAIPGGLLELEEMWRQHFLDTMKPKHMPELWSVQHNKERLEIRAGEGRLKKEDMMLSGFTSNGEQIEQTI